MHYYENSGEGLPHYVRYLKEWSAEHNVSFGIHYAPHDIAVRELSSGKSRLEAAKGMGLVMRPVQKHGLEDGIEQTRNFLPMCWIDRDECERGLDCLASYRKEWDSLRATFKSRPLHDWACHAADALRTLAWGMKLKRNVELKKQPQQYGDQAWSPF